jgi:hypothetical protein
MIAALVVATLLPLGCGRAPESQDPQADIIGKWESTDGELTLDFRPDGALIAHWDRGGLVLDTESETVFVDKNQLLGVWESGLTTYTVHIYGDEMTLEASEGEEINFKQIE